MPQFNLSLQIINIAIDHKLEVADDVFVLITSHVAWTNAHSNADLGEQFVSIFDIIVPNECATDEWPAMTKEDAIRINIVDLTNGGVDYSFEWFLANERNLRMFHC